MEVLIIGGFIRWSISGNVTLTWTFLKDDADAADIVRYGSTDLLLIQYLQAPDALRPLTSLSFLGEDESPDA